MERKIACATFVLLVFTVWSAVSLSRGRDHDQRQFSQKTIILEFAARLEEHEAQFKKQEHITPRTNDEEADSIMD